MLLIFCHLRPRRDSTTHCLSPSGYDVFGVKNVDLQYGDERKLLETLGCLVDHLLLIVRNTAFKGWDALVSDREQIAREFWELR